MRRELPLSRLPSLGLTDRGLTSSEVAERRSRYGRNDILEARRNPWLRLARDTAQDPMIWFLVGMSIAYLTLGSRVEALTLLVAIVPLVAMDAVLHRRTQASTAALGQQLAQRAQALRDGMWTEIAADELVVGDLVTVGTGESFPADGLILAGVDLQVDESSLTGEAYAVRKTPLTLLPSDRDGAAIDGEHWGYAGTRLLTSHAMARIIFTGAHTLYGEIVHSAVTNTTSRTPLQQAISHLVAFLLVAAGILCAILAAVRLYQGHDWVDALISAATLAVAALPEEFPVVFTLFLGVGVYRLAKRKVLVRRAVSVENLGRITCICADKTGTMTLGRLRLEHLFPAPGTGQERLLRLATLASRRETGDPMDVAIIDRFEHQQLANDGGEVLTTYAYTEQRRRETTIVRQGTKILAVSKGSPETLLPMSRLDPITYQRWNTQVDALAREGHKLLACVWWDLDHRWVGGEPDRGGEFAGLLACEDPVRPGVAEAVRVCRRAGIRVVMITGDHPATALAVASQIGLGGRTPIVVTGDQLEERINAGVTLMMSTADVIARALPSQKLAVVRALQADGELVAVTGDGVNDVPALQAADIGIAMGERGTRSAREVASIVLLDDNFGSIVRAIAEGRQLFRNLQLSFQYLLLVHIPLVITATFIPLTGNPILYLPIHVVWLEAIIHPTALLVFQNLPSATPWQADRRRVARFFATREWLMIGLIGSITTALTVYVYDRSLLASNSVEYGRTMALVALTTISATVTATLSRLRTRVAWWMTIATLASTVLFVQTPGLSRFMQVTSLHYEDWGIAYAGGLFAVVLPILLFQYPAFSHHAPSSRPRIQRRRRWPR